MKKAWVLLAMSAIFIFGAGYAPWNIEVASKGLEPRDIKPYTIMIYMNGSDLESENGMATNDIIEMLESGLDSSVANLIIFTGGTLRWFNDIIPPIDCVIWEIEDGYITEAAYLGLLNMGNPGTLASFIRFCKRNYPAEKYGLILWDHGGGSIAGFGHDEVFDEDNLSLNDMDIAFEKAGLRNSKLEFLGFDSCLMGSVEMAVIASRYADYYIASEDLEPGEGWDYSFLSAFNENPQITGGDIGAIIVDSFMDFYGDFSEENLSLSVIDLSKAGHVMDALGNLMDRCREDLRADRAPAFKTFARRRGLTKTFGSGSPRDDESDMVDIGDMARQLKDLFPDEAEAVLRALDDAVLYNRHNSSTDLLGLSSYYIFSGKETAEISMKTYESLNMSEGYTMYLREFSEILTDSGSNRLTRSGPGIRPKFDHENVVRTDLALWCQTERGEYVIAGLIPHDPVEPAEALWPLINGVHVCLYEINRNKQAVHYAVPAMHNGRDCDIVISFNARGQSQILGARSETGFIIQKGFDPVNPGDRLAFYYQVLKEDNSGGGSFLIPGGKDAEWRLGEAFTVPEGMELQWTEAIQINGHIGLLLTDEANNRLLSVPSEVY